MPKIPSVRLSNLPGSMVIIFSDFIFVFFFSPGVSVKYVSTKSSLKFSIFLRFSSSNSFARLLIPSLK